MIESGVVMARDRIVRSARRVLAGSMMIVAVLCASRARPSDYYEVTPEDVLGSADLVVVARVSDREVMTRADGSKCGFSFTLDVDSVLFGSLEPSKTRISVFAGVGTDFRADRDTRYLVVAIKSRRRGADEHGSRDDLLCEDEKSDYFATDAPQSFLQIGRIPEEGLAGDWAIESRESVLRAARYVRTVRIKRDVYEGLEAFWVSDLRIRLRSEIEALQRD